MSIACILKGASISTASTWVVKAKKDENALKDQRAFNGSKANEKLDKYVLMKFVEKRTKGLPISIRVAQAIALSAPDNLKPPEFQASFNWMGPKIYAPQQHCQKEEDACCQSDY